ERLDVALHFGENPITLNAYDFQGALVGTKSITITSTLPAPSAREFLRVTELHYHPAPPNGAELDVTSDKDDFEFIELCNLSSNPLEVGGCSFVAGIDFLFPLNTRLAAGERIVVVRNIAAFQSRYGAAHRIAGEYGPADSLNNNGELITLLDATGALIQSFAYNDAATWPGDADGKGHSLVPIAPHLSLNRDLPSNWRASLIPGGNPGSDDATVFAGLPAADADNDGIAAFLEYALGTSDFLSADGPGAVSAEPTFLLRFTRRVTADDVVYVLEKSNDLATWNAVPSELVSRVQLGSLLHETHRLAPPANGEAPLFVRLRVMAR
ncbi:MAG: lamin tail domain-containing protein, partial [Verrucomicrobiota bacterium]